MARPASPWASLALALLATLLVAGFAPSARAGAVYEDKKPILPNANQYLLVFNQTVPQPPGAPGSLVSATLPVPATTIPMATVTLKKCAVISVHYHPLASEQIFVRQGALEVGMFLEDGTVKRVTVNQGSAVLIPQGALHYVRNVAATDTTGVVVFDHPKAGAIFVAPALLALPRPVVNSAFTSDFPTGFTGIFYLLKGCTNSTGGGGGY